jgi:hypothetical protein
MIMQSMINVIYRFITRTNFEVSKIVLHNVVFGGLWEDWELSFWSPLQNLR